MLWIAGLEGFRAEDLDLEFNLGPRMTSSLDQPSIHRLRCFRAVGVGQDGGYRKLGGYGTYCVP